MPIIEYLHKYPFLRLIIPLILGIISGNYFFFKGINVSSGFLFVFLCLSVISLFVFYFIKWYSSRWVFGIPTAWFFFLAGFLLMHRQMEQVNYPFPENAGIYSGIIIQNPEYKDRSLLCRMHIESLYDSTSIRSVNKNVLVYFPLSAISDSFSRGDKVMFKSTISLPRMNGNPDEFDYPGYLLHKNISGTAFVPEKQWKLLESASDKSIRAVASDCRDVILEKYRQLGFQGDGFAVLSALTVGYKEELSEDIRQSFSVSGASHVLALSGLHIGLIYAILYFLLGLLPGNIPGFSLFRVLIIILTLWTFAFITGLSPSVVRSVIMFSILALAGLLNREAFSINTLCITAFFMLLFVPSWLYDVGFQLSFSAVAAIVIIQPWLYSKIRVKNKAGRYIWGLLTVSIAAQIGTAPLIIFYFHNFPMHFLLTSLLVIPLVSLIMYMAVVMLVFGFWPAVQQIIADVLQFLIKVLTGSVRWVENLPLSSVSNIWLSSADVWGLYLAFLTGVCLAIYRKPRYVLLLLILGVVFTAHHTWTIRSNRPADSIVFYNVRNCPAVHCISSSGKSWLACVDSIPDVKRISRAASDYWNRLQLDNPRIIENDFADKIFRRERNMLFLGNKKVSIINNNLWSVKQSPSPYKTDYLYICKGYSGTIEKLSDVFSFDKVVLDASLPAFLRKRFIAECERLQMECISLSDGAFIIRLS